MDTKLKNSRRIRVILAILAVIIITIGNIILFPLIGTKAEEEYQKQIQKELEYVGIDEYFLTELVMGSYVLYFENAEIETLPRYVAEMIEELGWEFEEYRYMTDYWCQVEENNSTNTGVELNKLLSTRGADESFLQQLQETYKCYLVLEYDANGNLSVGTVWDKDGREADIVNGLLWVENQNQFKDLVVPYIEDWYINIYGGEYGIEELNTGVEVFPQNCKVVYAVSSENYLTLSGIMDDHYWGRIYAYSIWGSILLYAGSLVVLLLVTLLITSKCIWKNRIDFNRRGPWYLAEVAIIGIFGIIMMHESFVYNIYSYFTNVGYIHISQLTKLENFEMLIHVGKTVGVVGLLYAVWCICIMVLRPILVLKPREYIRQYSLIYLICSKVFGWCKKIWLKTKEAVEHVDFSNKTVKTIRNLVIINFVVLAILSCFWFFGIIALVVYSVVLFIIIKKQYDRIAGDYQSLQQATSEIAQGNLQYEDETDWGVFEPLKDELAQIRSGFSNAVQEEVKSQRMKAELITNVSHDLKTPLTAITTYVELLKDEKLTEEERQSYVEILEKKSLQLKVLVEDLFEVSKATSNTIRLELLEVDVVNLLKQVCVEHKEHFDERGLSVKWKLPEEKVILMLDNQKTYRVFENLFVNIEKYAMPNSRVFVEVIQEEQVQIVIKNMSAQELSVTGEEITERFVRGDASRTTEGSGLGLAIAKSFTEAQGGKFEVFVDGDLFKVEITW